MKPVAANSVPRAHDELLEGLRGVAAFMVACSHAFCLNYLAPSVSLPEWLRVLEGGHAGVLLFFALSGFVVGWTNRQPFSAAAARDYAGRRAVRLAPIYYAAVALTVVVIWATGRHEATSSYVATVLGVQNFNPYFGIRLEPLITNGPLWSLNYEVLYYACFLWLWRFRPAAGWIFGPALVAGALGWFCPDRMPLFLASYGCGWLFWAAGWWLTHQPVAAPAEAVKLPVASGLLLVFASHRIDGLVRVFNALGWHSQDGGMVSLPDAGRLPAVILVLAAVTGRRLPGWRLWLAAAWLLLLVPLAGMLATGRLWGNVSWLIGTGATALAAGLAFVPGRDWLRHFAPFGSISYAFYVVHFPLLFVVGASALPAHGATGFVLRLAVWAGLAVGLAWVLERHVQPWLKPRLLPVRPA